ncbi:3-keto-steroid reductase-like protein [Emericellopsis cladophorae]|uniref:3-keto-steroid reductase-like protein n=1 Tax=Emericellopsis cladophorae TaxID=2686198 RepID=A0A9Q0BDZ3_9HYPO|nr:3-keto-steroid reductase-like protein [Emericellopsis cladophorae]KAI6781882.1 3-keto-steroid reductase-like protein [Emericellopsis cladophorae]
MVAEKDAPWAAAPPQDQLFVLITGANSGIGLSIGERLIDEFFATRSLTAHLTLLPTTRSEGKSRETIAHLRAYADKAARSDALKSRTGGEDDHARRIHILSVQLDLCDIRAIYNLAEDLCEETISNPKGTEGPDGELVDVSIPRLDAVVFNAGFGGWSGVNWPVLIWQFLTQGLMNSVTWPECKDAIPTLALNNRKEYDYPSKPLLGEVFTACLFGHYLLAHRLLPLLSRPVGSELHSGRIVWMSSIEAVGASFSLADFQTFDPSSTPYESVKRLTDILSLTCTLPSVKPISTSYLTTEEEEEERTPPKMYLMHPGIVASKFFPLASWLFGLYRFVMFFAQWWGSPWHTTDAYPGAAAATYLVLAPQEKLDAEAAERIKWASAVNAMGDSRIRDTEVDGWGFSGKVEPMGDEEEVEYAMRKRVGRHRDAKDVTSEQIVQFEQLGKECWEIMEELREEWEEILELTD